MSFIEFFFDFASPYSWLAFETIETSAMHAKVDIIWRPFLLGPIFQQQLGYADSPFNRNEARLRYMWRDLERETKRIRLPYQKPSVFPRNSVHASRLAYVGLEDTWGVDFLRAVFRSNFVDDEDISDERHVDHLLADSGVRIGFWPEVHAKAAAPPYQGRLRQATEEAMRRGVFGAPTFFAGGEMFFGNERLDEALAWAHRPHS